MVDLSSFESHVCYCEIHDVVVLLVTSEEFRNTLKVFEYMLTGHLHPISVFPHDIVLTGENSVEGVSRSCRSLEST